MASIVSTLEGLGSSITSWGKDILDSVFPPEKRAELLARLKAFTVKHPKLTAFLLTHIALSGGPLILFGLFSLTVLVFALIVALVVALLAAVLFTVIAVGTALLILFPTIFFTTLAASFLFLWGLGGYYIPKWFNQDSPPAVKGQAIGDKLNSLTGGRLDWVMGQARQGMAEDKMGAMQAEWKEPSPRNAPNGVSDGTPKKGANNASKGSGGSSSATDVGKDSVKPTTAATTGVDGAKKGAEGVQAATNQVTKTAGVNDVTDTVTRTGDVKAAPRKLVNTSGTTKGTLTGTLGGVTS